MAPLNSLPLAAVDTTMDAKSTLPPGPADRAADAYAAALKSHELARRPGESGLMRALAVAWAASKTERGR